LWCIIKIKIIKYIIYTNCDYKKLIKLEYQQKKKNTTGKQNERMKKNVMIDN